MYLLVKFFLHCDFKHFAFSLGRIAIQKGTTKTGLLGNEQKGISLYLKK